MNSITSIVIQNTRVLISKLGLKHKAVAEKGGYSQKQFSDMLNGRKNIDAIDVWRISSALGVTPNDLFGITTKQS